MRINSMTIDEMFEYLVKNNPNEKVKFIGSGTDSDAFRVGDLVCRFPHSADVFNEYSKESKVCDFVRNAISVPIPNIKLHDGDVQFAQHKMILGKKWRWHAFMFHPIKQRRLANGIARFFAELHSVDVSKFNQKSDKFAYVKFDDIADRISPFLSKHQMKFFREKYNSVINKPISKSDIVMCHLGIKGGNSVIDENGNLIGVFDFGNASCNERWRDLGVIYMANNERLYRAVLREYERLTGIKCDRKRIADVGSLEHFVHKRWFADDGSVLNMNDHKIKKYLAQGLVRFYHLPFRFRRILFHMMSLHKFLFGSK